MADLSKVLVKRVAADTYQARELYYKFVVPNCILRKLRLIGPRFISGVIDFGFEEFVWHSQSHFARLGFRIGAGGETDDLKLIVGDSNHDGVGSLRIYTTFDRTLYVRLHLECLTDEVEALANEIELEVTTTPRNGPPPLYQEVTVAGQTWRHANMPESCIGNNLILNSDNCLVFKYARG